MLTTQTEVLRVELRVSRKHPEKCRAWMDKGQERFKFRAESSVNGAGIKAPPPTHSLKSLLIIPFYKNPRKTFSNDSHKSASIESALPSGNPSSGKALRG